MNTKKFTLSILFSLISIGLLSPTMAWPAAKRDREADEGRHIVPTGPSFKTRMTEEGVEHHHSNTFRIRVIRRAWGALGEFLSPFHYKGRIYRFVVLHSDKMQGVQEGALYKGTAVLAHRKVITGILSGIEGYPDATIENTLMIINPELNDQ